MKPTAGSVRVCAATATLVALTLTSALAITPHEGSPAEDKLFMEPEFHILNWPQPVDQLSPELQESLAADLAALDVAADKAFYDLRGGALNSLILARPMVPGPGVGNDLAWDSLGLAEPASDAEYGSAALAELESFLAVHGASFGVDSSELEPEPTVGVLEARRLTQIHIAREVDGVPVRYSGLNATINSGNLLLIGTRNWGPIDVSTVPSLTPAEAEAVVAGHLSPFTVTGELAPTHLELLPQARGEDPNTVTPGDGYTYRLAWVVTVVADGVYGTLEGLVDAHSGQLMALTDVNNYLARRTVGGIFPVSNDGTCQGQPCAPGLIPDGIEQPGHPMPFATVTFPDGSTAVTNTAGLGDFDGPFRTALTGPYVSMVDTCGFIDEGTVCTDLDLGVSGGTDCVTPDFSDSLGNTHSSRTGFYELNRMIEVFRSRIAPGDPAFAFVNGLPVPVTAEMNIDQNCNANFNPVTLDINFFTSGSIGSNICRNTGEIAAVFDHEWGHFMDFADGNGLSSPSEAYADIAGITRLNDTCVGRGFFEDNSLGGVCSGFGNTCTECSGVRDDDFLKKIGMLPSDVDWASGNHATIPGGCVAPSPVPVPTPGAQSAPCGGSVHCNGTVPGEAVVDLFTRDLRCMDAGGWENVPGDGSGPVQGGQCVGGAAPTMDANTALELATLMFVGAKGNINQWFVCNNAVGGCGADSGYHQFLAADDDDGSFANGTPHHEAIFEAFNRHQIACPASAPPLVNTSCPLGSPARVQNLIATPGVSSVELAWDAVPGALEYWVYRTEGVLGCASGKKRIAVLDATAGTSYLDVAQDNMLEDSLNTTAGGLLDGFEYFYTVLAAGTPGCLGDMSECASAIPDPPSGGFAGGASVGIEQGETTITTGDGDEFLDNCESATIGMTVANDGGVDLTNVEIVAIQAIAPAGVDVTINTPLPIALGNLASVCGAPGFATPSFNFKVESGLAQDDTLVFEVSVLADQFSGVPQTGQLFVSEAENDFEVVSEILFDFDDGTLDDWTVVQGTFNNTAVPPPGAQTTTNYMASSSFEDFACDKIRSPKLQLTATSTLSLYNQFATEFEAPGGVFTGFYDRANVGLIDSQGVRIPIEPDGGRPYNAFTSPGSTYAGCNEPELGWATDPDFPDFGAVWAESTWSATALDAASLASQTVRIEVINATDSTLSGVGFQFDQVRVTDVKLRAADTFDDLCVPDDNQAPVTLPDSDTTDQGVAKSIDVLANDSDPDGDDLTVTSVTNGANGTVTIDGPGPDNTVTYDPDPAFHGTDSFLYTVCDDGGPTNSAAPKCVTETVTVTVNHVPNKCIEPGEQILTDPEGDVGFLGSPGLPQHDVLSLEIAQAAIAGPATDNYIFTLKMASLAAPLPNDTTWPVVFKYNGGADRFVRMWTDAAGVVTFDYGFGTNPSPFSSPGTPADPSSSFDTDGTIRIVVPGSFFGAPAKDDVLGPFLTRIRIEAAGSALTPDNMPDSLVAAGSYTIVDCLGAPEAEDDSYIVSFGATLDPGASEGVLANDSDPQNDPLTAVLDSGPGFHVGIFTLNADGSFSYTHDGSICPSPATDSFTYHANDGTSDSNIATVTIDVVCPGGNEPPTAGDDAFTMDEDTVLANSVAGNDSDPATDPPDEPLSWNRLSDPSRGTLAFNGADGSFTYTPEANFHGTDSFTYEACDNPADPADQLCDEATVTITVEPVNDDPVANDDGYTTDEDVSLVVSAPGVLANDTDLDGDMLFASLVSDVSNGSLALAADGSFTYTPDGDYNGSDTFIYRACDRPDGHPEQLCDTASVTITVESINDPPVATDDDESTPHDTPVEIAVLANDFDPDGDPLRVDSTTEPANGTAMINSDNTVTYTPDAGFAGTDSFLYVVCDEPANTCDTAAVTVTVGAAPVSGGKTTGGGWLMSSDGKKINFGFNARQKVDGPQGNLHLNDKGTGTKVHLSTLTFVGEVGSGCGSVVAGPDAIEFRGLGTLDGLPAEFRVCVEDKGEPGSSSSPAPDKFYLECVAGCGYSTGVRTADDLIDGGNIQVHEAAGGSGGESAWEGEDESQPRTIVLQPVLLDEAEIGLPRPLTARAYNAAGGAAAGAQFTLRWLDEELTATADIDGVAVFTIVPEAGETGYVVSAGALNSNAISLWGISP